MSWDSTKLLGNRRERKKQCRSLFSVQTFLVCASLFMMTRLEANSAHAKSAFTTPTITNRKKNEPYCLPTKTTLANVPDSTRSLMSRASRGSSPLLPVTISSRPQATFTRQRPFVPSVNGTNSASPPLFMDISLEDTYEIQERQLSRYQAQADLPIGGWKLKLLKASNVASLLCVVDCTVLPIVTILLPLFGIVAGTPAQMELIHKIGHKAALYFVLPVGGLATSMNYLYAHRKRRIAAMGCLGLSLVLMANSGGGCCGHNHNHVAATASLFRKVLNAARHGITHRIVNISGCALLLGSNYLSRVAGCICKDPNCNL